MELLDLKKGAYFRNPITIVFFQAGGKFISGVFGTAGIVGSSFLELSKHNLMNKMI
jgi:hypothetical protein